MIISEYLFKGKSIYRVSIQNNCFGSGPGNKLFNMNIFKCFIVRNEAKRLFLLRMSTRNEPKQSFWLELSTRNEPKQSFWLELSTRNESKQSFWLVTSTWNE